MWMMIFAAGLLLAVFLAFDARRVREQVEKAEFERRTSGGTLEFATWEDAKAHQRRRNGVGLRMSVSMLLGMVCSFGLVAVFLG